MYVESIKNQMIQICNKLNFFKTIIKNYSDF